MMIPLWKILVLPGDHIASLSTWMMGNLNPECPQKDPRGEPAAGAILRPDALGSKLGDLGSMDASVTARVGQDTSINFFAARMKIIIFSLVR
jgi:hypothetical protein